MQSCIFFCIVASSAASWNIHETNVAYAFLDINPLNEYRTLVIPEQHHLDVFDVHEDELPSVMSALRACR